MGEALEKLTADPSLGLAHLYRPGKFTLEPGVEVIGAGNPRINGWYHHREASEGPPRNNVRNYSREGWLRHTQGRPWYEQDNGCYIDSFCIITAYVEWNCCDPTEELQWITCYRNQTFTETPLDASLPPEGWSHCRGGSRPAPTLRVVNS